MYSFVSDTPPTSHLKTLVRFYVNSCVWIPQIRISQYLASSFMLKRQFELVLFGLGQINLLEGASYVTVPPPKIQVDYSNEKATPPAAGGHWQPGGFLCVGLGSLSLTCMALD